MNVCFFGVGGVGGCYGILLTKYFDETGEGNTYFIASGAPDRQGIDDFQGFIGLWELVARLALFAYYPGGKLSFSIRPQQKGI